MTAPLFALLLAMQAAIVEGTATVQRRGGAAQPLAQGGDLGEGDVVETGPDSRVEISMSGGSTLRLGEKARLQLRTAPPSGQAFGGRLWLGSVWAKVHKLLRGQSFEIETDNAVAGVRGTEFLAEAGRVRVYEGVVEVRDPAGAWVHRVEPGRELAVRAGLRPSGPAVFDRASDRNHPLMRWVREREEREHERRKGKDDDQRDKKKRDRDERRHRFFERFRGR